MNPCVPRLCPYSSLRCPNAGIAKRTYRHRSFLRAHLAFPVNGGSAGWAEVISDRSATLSRTRKRGRLATRLDVIVRKGAVHGKHTAASGLALMAMTHTHELGFAFAGQLQLATNTCRKSINHHYVLLVPWKVSRHAPCCFGIALMEMHF
jgi:hypothetical protein